MNGSRNEVSVSYRLILSILFFFIFSMGLTDASTADTHNLFGGKSFAPLSEALYFFDEDSKHSKASTNPYLDRAIKNIFTPDRYLQTSLFKSLLKNTFKERFVLPNFEELIVRNQHNFQEIIPIPPSPPPRI